MPNHNIAVLRRALKTDRTIDIVTVGARSGVARTTEIWFTNIAGNIIICGTPGATDTPNVPVRRDWLANLMANPNFLFRFKESLQAEISAHATVVDDVSQRHAYMRAPETQWYRDQGCSVDVLVMAAPIVEVTFTGDYAVLNQTHSTL